MNLPAGPRGIQERWINSYLEVLNHKGYKEASDALGQDLGTLKDDVKNLEACLKVKLLQARPASASPAGTRLLPYLRHIRACLREAHEIAGADPKTLRVRVRGYPVHVPMIVAEAAQAFLASHDDPVRFEFQEATSLDWDASMRDLFGPVVRRTADVAIGGHPRNLRYIELYRTKLVAISYRAEDLDAWGDRGFIRIDELFDVPLVTLGTGTFCHQLLRDEGLLDEENPFKTGLSVKLSSAGALVSLVQRGVAVGIMTEDLANSWTVAADEGDASPHPVQLLIQDRGDQSLELQVCAHFRSRDDCEDEVRTFIKILERTAHDRYHQDSHDYGGCLLCFARR